MCTTIYEEHQVRSGFKYGKLVRNRPSHVSRVLPVAWSRRSRFDGDRQVGKPAPRTGYFSGTTSIFVSATTGSLGDLRAVARRRSGILKGPRLSTANCSV